MSPTGLDIVAAKRACWGLLEHPLVQRFLEDWARLRGADLRVTEAWQVAAEQRIQAACIGLGQIAGSADVTVAPSLMSMLPDMTEDQVRVAIAGRLYQATPYLWRIEMEAAADAFELPDHVFTRAALHSPNMYWSYETAHGTPETGFLDWMFVHDTGNGALFVWLWNQQMGWQQDSPTILECAYLAYGTRYPQDMKEDTRRGIDAILKRMAFLHSPYVDTTQTGVPRHIRKDLKRKGLDLPVDSNQVRVVSLRERPKMPTRTRNEQSSREYHHRWWVRPHSRVVSRGTDQEHVVAIPRHWKGPDGAPWVQPKVYMVNR